MNINENFQKDYNEALTLASVILAIGYKTENQDSYFASNLISKFGLDNVIESVPVLPKINKGDSIAANIFLIKVPSHGLKITAPDWLIYLIDVCSGGNPGFIQIIYKELLEFINLSKFNGKGIKKDYTILVEDFALCFATEFPIMLQPRVYEKYSKLWDEQKRERNTSFEPDNKCDTDEYWLEVMEK